MQVDGRRLTTDTVTRTTTVSDQEKADSVISHRMIFYLTINISTLRYFFCFKFNMFLNFFDM